MGEKKERRRWKSEEKLRIVLAGLDETIEITELCRREGKATRPDERWATDLMYIEASGRQCCQLSVIDEYSRYIVHHELLTNMEGGTVSLEAQRAIEQLLQEQGGEIRRPARRRITATAGAATCRATFARCWTNTA